MKTILTEQQQKSLNQNKTTHYVHHKLGCISSILLDKIEEKRNNEHRNKTFDPKIVKLYVSSSLPYFIDTYLLNGVLRTKQSHSNGSSPVSDHQDIKHEKQQQKQHGEDKEESEHLLSSLWNDYFVEPMVQLLQSQAFNSLFQ